LFVGPDVVYAGGDRLTLVIAKDLVDALSQIEAQTRAGTPLAKIAISLAIGTDVFVEIAKLRAARLAFAKLAAACKVHVTLPLLHAMGSKLEDPDGLRATLQAFAALIGGADAITIPAQRSARLARNTPLVLELESHLH